MKKQATKNPHIERKEARPSEVQNILNQAKQPLTKSREILFPPPSPQLPQVDTPIPSRKFSNERNGPRTK